MANFNHCPVYHKLMWEYTEVGNKHFMKPG